MEPIITTERLLRDLKLPAPWKLGIRAEELHGRTRLSCYVHGDVPDNARTVPWNVHVVGRQFYVEPTVREYPQLAGILHRVREELHYILMHEADEQITFRGERVFDPHAEQDRFAERVLTIPEEPAKLDSVKFMGTLTVAPEPRMGGLA